MRIARKIVLSSLLITATLFSQNVSAAIAPLTDLPDSTYAIENDNWQGYTMYEKDGFNLLIDFVVYDSDNINPNLTDNELYFVREILQETLGLTGRFIYAYQIFQYPFGEPGDTKDVGYFGILDNNGNEISGTDVNSITDDFPQFTETQEGKAPAENINTPIGWRWDDWNPLATSEESWFLVYSSDFEPIIGDFKIEEPRTSTSDFAVRGGPPASSEAPEPATLALLGIGGIMIFSRRRRSI